MSRFASPRALSAVLLLALALPAAAAEATRVASSGDEDNPFDLDFTMKAEYVQTRALITREYTYDYAKGQPLSTVQERPELRYARRTFALLPRLAIGLWKDLEVHVETPVILSSDVEWHYAFQDGKALTDGTSATGNTDVNPDGKPCTGGVPCGMFSADQTVYHGAGFGDLKLGFAWGVLSDARDDTKPFWLVGVDFTFPTSKMYDPGLDRSGARADSPYNHPGNSGPFGENVFKIDFVTALSKRMGAADPYVKFHATSYRPSAQTYSNCAHATDGGQYVSNAKTICDSTSSTTKYGSRPPWVAGAAFGAEVVTGENRAEGTRVALDFRLSADYTSSARWYNELTDATGKILSTEDYFTLQALFGFYWRASKYMQLQATAHLATETPHFLTGEIAQRDAAGNPTNPNYDARYDAAGRRYRITEVSDFGLAIAGVLQF